MIEKRIKSLRSMELNFKAIKQEVRNNIEQGLVHSQIKAKKKMPYMRTIRAVSYALCICTAAAVLTFIVKETNFWNKVAPPSPVPGTAIGETEKGETCTQQGILPPIISETESLETHQGTSLPDNIETELPSIMQSEVTPPYNLSNDIPLLSDPGKYEKLAEKFDRFFAFGTIIHPKLIMGSDMLNENDFNTFSQHVSKSGNEYYIVYLGTTKDVDIVLIIDWISSETFEFVSNLNYQYDEIISRFEQESGVCLTDEYLCGNQSNSEMGINLLFKKSGEGYIPFYEAVIDNKAYVIDNEASAASDNTNTSDLVVIPNYLVSYGFTRKLDDKNADLFDTFLAFTTIQMGDVYNLGLISEEDWNIFKPYNSGEYDVYLGTKEGVDYVLLTSSPQKTFIFKSNLDYSYKEVIAEFERLSGCELTDEFLTTSAYDNYLRRETGGISLCFRFETGENHSCEIPYFRAIINGKVYVVDTQ